VGARLLVAGIVRRSWRPYCGILLETDQAVRGEDHFLLFSAKEATIPPIRLRVKQPDRLRNQQIVVVVDGWPLRSKFPVVWI
jgi:exosome complex exonuclease DIS3/RRP44